jgi:quercetin dioxygenase-like cupin family protein
MKTSRLSDMKLGWFIGNFTPTLHATEACEVAVKEYPAGAYDAWHYHKVATEYTVIVSGAAEMNGVRYGKGDIIVIPPGEGTDFRTLEPTVTVVVKMPGATNDKYLRGQ